MGFCFCQLLQSIIEPYFDRDFGDSFCVKKLSVLLKNVRVTKTFNKHVYDMYNDDVKPMIHTFQLNYFCYVLKLRTVV